MRHHFTRKFVGAVALTLSCAASAITVDPVNVVVPMTINGTAYEVRIPYADLAFALSQAQANKSANHVVTLGTNFQAQDGHVYSIGTDGSLWRDGRAWLSTKVQQLIFVGPEIYAYGAATGLLYRYCASGCATTWVAVTSYPNGMLDKVPAPVTP